MFQTVQLLMGPIATVNFITERRTKELLFEGFVVT